MPRCLSGGKFISKMDALPPDDICQDYLIKGLTWVELPEKYIVCGHIMVLEIEFYALMSDDEPKPLSHAIITGIDVGCCTVEETKIEHKKKLREFGIYSYNIGEFIDLTKETFDMDSMDSWILIKDLENEKEPWEKGYNGN